MYRTRQLIIALTVALAMAVAPAAALAGNGAQAAAQAGNASDRGPSAVPGAVATEPQAEDPAGDEGEGDCPDPEGTEPQDGTGMQFGRSGETPGVGLGLAKKAASAASTGTVPGDGEQDMVRERVRDRKLTGIANAQGKIARNIERLERRLADGKPGKMAKGLLEVDEKFCKWLADGSDDGTATPDPDDGSEDETDTPEPDEGSDEG